MKNLIKTNALVFIFALFSNFEASATDIQGLTSVSLNQTEVYTYDAGMSILAPEWIPTGGIKIGDPSVTGTQYSVAIQWTSAGTQELRLENGGTILSTISVQVTGSLSPGSISGSTTICSGNTPGLLSSVAPATGGTGVSYQWQSSSNNSTWNDIVGATQEDYDPGNLSSTTYFRRNVTSGSNSENTNTVTITVVEQLTGISIQGSTEFCSGSSININFSINGNVPVDAIVSWQKYSGSSWDPAPGSNTRTTYSESNVTAGSQYKYVLTNTCGSVVDQVTINQNPTLSVGDPSGSTTVCSGTGGTTLAASVNNGNGSYTYTWLSSSTENGTYSAAAGTNNLATYSTETLTSKTYFKLQVQDDCTTITSENAAAIDVFQPLTYGSIGPSQVICSGTIPGQILNQALPENGSGDISYFWQYSTTNSSPWTTAPGNNTSPTYTPTQPVSTKTWFRRREKDNVCNITKFGAKTFVDVESPIGAVSIDGQTDFCSGSVIDVSFNISGAVPDDAIVSWQKYSGSGWDAAPGSNTRTTYTESNVAAGSQYKYTLSNSCGSVEDQITITQSPMLSVGDPVGSTMICSGTDGVILTAPVNNGKGNYSYTWLSSSTENGTYGLAPGTNNQASYTTETISTKTYFKLQVQDDCNTIISENAAAIDVFQPMTNGAVGPSQVICAGDVPGEILDLGLPGGGSGDFSYLWQYRESDSGPFTTAPGNNTGINYTPSLPATTKTWYRRRAYDNICGSYTYQDKTYIEVQTQLNSISISGDTDFCAGTTINVDFSVNGTVPDDAIVSWLKYSGLSWDPAPGSNTRTTYSESNVAAGSQYKYVLTNSCGSVDDQVTITQSPMLSVGDPVGSTTICTGTNGNVLTAPVNNGKGSYVYTWLTSPSETGSYSPAPGIYNQDTYTTETISTKTYFKLQVQDDCHIMTSNIPALIDVYEPLTSGSIGPPQVVCTGEIPDEILNLALPEGGSGSYSYRWKYKTSDTSETNAPGDNNNLTYVPIEPVTTKTWFRRVVKDNVCNKYKYNAKTTVDIEDYTIGSISLTQGTNPFCSNSPMSIELTYSGGDIPVDHDLIKWQKFDFTDSTWQIVSPLVFSNTYSTTISETSKFRVQSIHSCATLNSNEIIISTYPDLIQDPGPVGTFECNTATGITLTAADALGGNPPYSYQWLESDDSNGTYYAAPGDSNNEDYTVQTIFDNRYYKRMVVDQCLDTLMTNPVNVYPHLSDVMVIGSDASICIGDPGVTINHVGILPEDYESLYIFAWEYTDDLSGTWNLAPGDNNNPSYTTDPLTTTTHFRRRVRTNECGPELSNVVTITVNPLPAVDAGYDLEVFTTNDLILLDGTGENPSGGSWNGLGMSSAPWFDPGDVNPGIYQISYSLTENGCTNSDFKSIEVDCPEIIVNGPIFLNSETTTTLSLTKTYESYQWIYNGTDINSANSSTFDATLAGIYSVRVTNTQNREGEAKPVTLYLKIQDQEVNYVLTLNAQKEVDETMAHFNDASTIQQSFNYIDGLGRTMQEIRTQGSPMKQDLVQSIAYDSYGRQEFEYLPHTDSLSDGFFRPITFQGGVGSPQREFYQNTNNVIADDEPFAYKVFDGSPLNRVREQYGAGKAWHENQKRIVMKHELNDSSDLVKDIGISNGSPTVLSLSYESNMLMKNITIDEEENESVEFIDKLGRTVLKRVVVNNDSVSMIWADTYYVYDEFNNLQFVFPPMLSDEIGVGQVSQNQLDRWAFQYQYDERQRMIAKRVPGTNDWTYMVYDQRDRLVLTQDANQRLLQHWQFTKYDTLNRPILTGITQINDSIEAVRNTVNDIQKFCEQVGNGYHGYTNQAFPIVNNADDFLTVTYYDSYDNLDQNHFQEAKFNYTSELNNGFNFSRVNGQVVGTKVKKLDDNQWLGSVSYYDSRYRAIQVISENHQNGTDKVSTQFDFRGHPLKTKTTHDFNGQVSTIKRKFEYDHGGRLTEVKHKINDQPKVTLIDNEYNELGELIDKKLHSEDETHFVQSIDYDYNIRGWLTNVNDMNLTVQDNVYEKDFFGMFISYHISFPQLNITGKWNGNIAALGWSDISMNNDLKTHGYAYEYDALNRLKEANHVEQHINDGWRTSDHFSVNNINYDLNGNITSLTRKNEFGSNMDSLQYDYAAQGELSNRLIAVSDGGDPLSGFKDKTIGGIEYDYDNNGNMVKDLNKGIDSIYYNHLNLPIKVDFDSGNYIEYAYDAAGLKLQQRVFENNVLAKTTDYIGEYIYETLGTDPAELNLIQHEEGRIIPQANGAMGYQYHLKDHLGNVRMTIARIQDDYLATMEPGNADDEFFENVDNPVPYPPGQNAARVNSDNPIGPAFTSYVSAGDVIDMSVKAYYENLSGYGTNGLGLATMSSLIAQAFSSATLPGISENLQQLIEDNLNQNVGIAALGGATGDDSHPAAYLNYLVFDSTFNFLPNKSGFVGISEAPNLEQTLTATNLVIDEPGYVFIYVSNESNSLVPVYFDDLSITHTNWAPIQSDDYYPFGLTFNSYTRSGIINQKFKFNDGTERIDEFSLNLDFAKYRTYDASLGRFNHVDPKFELLQKSWTPYHFAFNNPIKYNDPNGDIPPHVVVGAIAAGWEYGNQVYSNYRNGDTGFEAWVGNVDFGDVLIEGVATGSTLGGSKLTTTIGVEFLKESIDINGSGDVKFIGQEGKELGSVLMNTGVNTLANIAGDKVGKKFTDKATDFVKKYTKDVGNAHKNLAKSVRTIQNHNRRTKAKLPKQSYDNLRVADTNLQISKFAATESTNTHVTKAAENTTKRLYTEAKEWIMSFWDD